MVDAGSRRSASTSRRRTCSALARALGCAGTSVAEPDGARRRDRRGVQRATSRRWSPCPRSGARDAAAVHERHVARPGDRPARLPRDRPADRRRERRRAADARGLHRRRGRRPRARDEPQGGRRVRPGGPLHAVRRGQGRHRLRPVRPRGTRRAARATSRRCARSSSATGRPARTSACARTCSTRSSPTSGCAPRSRPRCCCSTIPTPALRRLRDGFAVDVDGIGLGELVGGYGVAEAALAALERLGLGDRRDARGRAGLRLDGRRDRALPRARAACAVVGDRRPRRARLQPGRARRRARSCTPATRTARSTGPRSARRTSGARAPTGSRSTPSCSSPPRCRT